MVLVVQCVVRSGRGYGNREKYHKTSLDLKTRCDRNSTNFKKLDVRLHHENMTVLTRERFIVEILTEKVF